MNRVCAFYESTIGKKILMALTGLILFGFVAAHMAGNLKAFAGFTPDGVAKLDHYAATLRAIGADFVGHETTLWIARAVLLGSLVLHVLCAIQISVRNRASRATNYSTQRFSSSTFAARYMMIGGCILLAFIIFHILHFTTGTVHLDGFVEGHVYANVYSAFQHKYLVAIYVISMVVLGTHLFHGGWSLFQTLGLDSPGVNPAIRTAIKVFAVVVVLGFISVPLAIHFKLVPPPSATFLPSELF